jgi:hypothetical protein
MAEVIVVAPIEGGWCVQRGLNEPWTFEGRPQAEWSARRLGELLAEAGEVAEIRVLRLDGGVESRFVLAASQELASPLPA